jgi:Tfp pilus assembly protein PilN
MRPALNLATRPFRNERLPSLLFGLAAVAVLALTAQHALMLKDLLPGRVSALDREAVTLEQEVARLRSEAQSLQGPRPDPERLKQWVALRGLVDRRAFSWSALLASLEDVLPTGVRLVSIAPNLRDGQVWLDIRAIARRFEDRQALLHSLEKSPRFEDVFLQSAGESDRGEEFNYSARYLPGVPASAASPAPAAPASEVQS